MKYYVGLDVSMNETAVCITDEGGEIIQETMVATDPGSIAKYLQSANLSLESIGLEASNLSIWLYHNLSATGYPVIVIETRHAKAAMAAQNVKTDRNDARGIAHIMRTGWFKHVHVKSDESQRIRLIINGRKTLVQQKTVLENQIRGSLKTFGLKTGKVTRHQYEPRIWELIEGDGELEMAISPLLEVRALIVRKIHLINKSLIMAARKDDMCRAWMTIPGIGPITALLYKATIDDPKRFKRPRHVGPHLGLTPRKYASGETDFNGGITKCGDQMLRYHLYNAAATMLRKPAKKNRVKSWGLQIAKRSNPKKAKVAVARKLAIIMHRMWLDGTEFDFGTEPRHEVKTAA